jgi:hypothetical protein
MVDWTDTRYQLAASGEIVRCWRISGSSVIVWDGSGKSTVALKYLRVKGLCIAMEELSTS